MGEKIKTHAFDDGINISVTDIQTLYKIYTYVYVQRWIFCHETCVQGQT